MSLNNRRYDIDWLGVIAIGLLLFYHAMIGFQTWGIMIGFITNAKPWGSLLPIIAMLNIWRFPLLFFVSGIGVYFAIQHRSWLQLLKEKGCKRSLYQSVFGIFAIVPIHMYLLQSYYQWELNYEPGARTFIVF